MPRGDAAITVDGVLDEPVWATAALRVGCSQAAPSDGRPTVNDTEILVWYSATAIHFGIKAHAEPGSVRATLADRDRIDADDSVESSSTFNDGRRATVFGVNPPRRLQLGGALSEDTRARRQQLRRSRGRARGRRT